MMKDGYWVIRTYKAGNVGEKIKFWIPNARPSKSSRKIKSDLKKIKQNEASAVKRLARVINANFSHGDILLGLDYSPVKGPEGNIEYLMYVKKGGESLEFDTEKLVELSHTLNID